MELGQIAQVADKQRSVRQCHPGLWDPGAHLPELSQTLIRSARNMAPAPGRDANPWLGLTRLPFAWGKIDGLIEREPQVRFTPKQLLIHLERDGHQTAGDVVAEVIEGIDLRLEAVAAHVVLDAAGLKSVDGKKIVDEVPGLATLEGGRRRPRAESVRRTTGRGDRRRWKSVSLEDDGLASILGNRSSLATCCEDGPVSRGGIVEVVIEVAAAVAELVLGILEFDFDLVPLVVATEIVRRVGKGVITAVAGHYVRCARSKAVRVDICYSSAGAGVFFRLHVLIHHGRGKGDCKDASVDGIDRDALGLEQIVKRLAKRLSGNRGRVAAKKEIGAAGVPEDILTPGNLL